MLSQHIQLQEAHEAQQKLVRELQSKVAKYRKCYETSRKQETVISQLEALLALEAGDRRAGNALSIVSKENADLRATLREYQDADPDHRKSLLGEKEETIATLRNELERVTKQRQSLEEQLARIPGKSAGVNSGKILEQTTKIYELEQKMKVTEARENTLMKELEENGRRWAQEKARYEIQLTELQTRLGSNTRGPGEAEVQSWNSPLSLAPSRPLLSQDCPPQASSVTENQTDSRTLQTPHQTQTSNLPVNQSAPSAGHYNISFNRR